VVGPLSVGAIHRFLRSRLGWPLTRQTLLRVHEQSGGNPLFAVELAQRLGRDIHPLEPLPASRSLAELVGDRISRLPRRTRDVLALTAALGAPDEDVLRRAGVATEVLRPAIAAKVVVRDRGAIRFTHPVLASSAYQSAGADLRSIHALAA